MSQIAKRGTLRILKGGYRTERRPSNSTTTGPFVWRVQWVVDDWFIFVDGQANGRNDMDLNPTSAQDVQVDLFLFAFFPEWYRSTFEKKKKREFNVFVVFS